MSNKGVRNLFIFGSAFFFLIFLALTYDTLTSLDKRAPEITEAVDQGKMLWQKYDCIGCHTIFGNGSYFAPDLTKTTDRKPASYIVKFLMDPRKVKSTAAMPRLGITEDEAQKLVAFLTWCSKVDTNGWPPKPVLASLISASGGVAVYQKYACNNCHIIGGVGGTSGPDLSGVGTRKPDPEWHKRHLVDPQAVVKDSAMPPYPQLTRDELQQLADYLVTLK